MTGKDKLMAEYIDQLIDGFEDKRYGMSALLKMVIKIGCDYNKSACHEECKDCPLTSYLCRQMHTQSKLLLEDNGEDCNGI